MVKMEAGVLLIQAVMVGVPLIFILLTIHFYRAARAFDRCLQNSYPHIANEVKNHWPVFLIKLSPFPLLYCSLYENDIVKDNELRTLRKKAIVSFLTICVLVALLVLWAFCIDATTTPGQGQ